MADEFVNKENIKINSYDELQEYKRLNNFRLVDNVMVPDGVIIVSTYFSGIVKPFKSVCYYATTSELYDEFKNLVEDSISQSDAIIKHNEIVARINEIEVV